MDVPKHFLAKSYSDVFIRYGFQQLGMAKQNPFADAKEWGYCEF